MPQRDIEKLLGGYATDTLTEEERKELFAAALRDQTLFNALADEHALKEVLDDPRARRLLIDALKKKTTQRYWLENFLAWLRRPSSWALAGSVAVALLAITFVIRMAGLPTPETERMAGVKAPPPPTSEPAAPAIDMAKTPEPTPFEGERQKNKQRPQSPSPGAAPAEESVLRERRAAKLAAPESAASDSKKSDGGNQVAEQPPALDAPLAKERDSAQETEVPSRILKYQGLANRARLRPNIPYTLLRRGPDGLYAPIDPATNFKAGEAVRIAIEPTDDGYLYALWADEAGKFKMVFPTGETGGEAAKVEKDRRYLLPPEDAFTFPAAPGDRKVLILLSHAPLEFPEKLESLLREKNAPVNTRTGRSAGESARTEAEQSSPAPQAAPQQPAGKVRKDLSPVTVEIVLKHR
jgi:hypothetical protein